MSEQERSVAAAVRHGWFVARQTCGHKVMWLRTARGLHPIVILVDPYGIVTRV